METKELKQIGFEEFSKEVKNKRVYTFKDGNIKNKIRLKEVMDYQGLFSEEIDEDDFHLELCWKNIIFFGSKDRHYKLTDFKIQNLHSRAIDIQELELNKSYQFVIKDSYLINLLVVGIVETSGIHFLWLIDDEENDLLCRIVKYFPVEIKLIKNSQI